MEVCRAGKVHIFHRPTLLLGAQLRCSTSTKACRRRGGSGLVCYSVTRLSDVESRPEDGGSYSILVSVTIICRFLPPPQPDTSKRHFCLPLKSCVLANFRSRFSRRGFSGTGIFVSLQFLTQVKWSELRKRSSKKKKKRRRFVR